MSNKKVKLKSVERNVRRETRAKRKNPPKPSKKQDESVKRIDNTDFEEINRKRIEEAKKANVVVLSEAKKTLEEKKEPEPKKTFKDPLWYIGSGVLWLFDTIRGRTEKAEEPSSIVDEEETVASEPISEPESAPEPEPEPEPELEPVAETEEPESDDDSDDEVEDKEDPEDDDDESEDDGNGFVIIKNGEDEGKKTKGFSVAYLSRYAKTAARGADIRIKENVKLQRRKDNLERKLDKFSIPKKATEETVIRLNEEKDSMIKELAELEEKINYNYLVAESLERAADEYAYIRNKVDGTVFEGLRKTERLHEEKIEVDQKYLDSLIEKYNAAKKADESK